MKNKKSFLLLMLIFVAISAYNQITLEHTYSQSGTYIYLPSVGNKFYVMDVDNSQCRIYNLDHSLWKTINLSVPNNNWLYDIKYVTEGLFTTDNSISLLYVYYNYNETGQYYTYNARIVKENGQLLLNLPGCQYAYVNNLSNGTTKLVTYSYNYAVWPYTIQTGVYSLPGELITGDVSDPQQPAYGIQAAFPNPAISNINIPYFLPDGLTAATLILMDGTGKKLKSFPLNSNSGTIDVPTSGLPRGVYFYMIESDYYQSARGKIILQ